MCNSDPKLTCSSDHESDYRKTVFLQTATERQENEEEEEFTSDESDDQGKNFSDVRVVLPIMRPRLNVTLSIAKLYISYHCGFVYVQNIKA